MSKFYYLHLWALAEFIQNQKDLNVETDSFLEFDSWPIDDLFSAWPIIVVSEQLRWELDSRNIFDKISFSKIESIMPGANFKQNFPDAILPSRFWRIDFLGIPGKDDFGLSKEGQHLVVSEKALAFLRDHRVTHAEADFIDQDLDDYFSSERKYFWMKVKINFPKK